MTALGLFLLAIFLLVGWLLCLAYRETEQDFPPASRHHRPCNRDVYTLSASFDIKKEIRA
jgi:hypothetical protein